MAKKIEKIRRVEIDDERINHTIEAYFKWKDLNTYIKSVSTRGINMPDAISEPMGCWCMGYLWNRGKEVGDAYDPKTNKKIEFKATSNYDTDLSSIGPKTKFDNLVFLRYNLSENKLYIYDLETNSDQLAQMNVNRTQKIGDQKEEKRRPHIGIIKLFKLDEKEPTVVFDIRKGQIEVDNR